MVLTGRSLTCADCGAPVTFSADDQAYHAEKGFTNEPKRCQDCRSQRRSQQGGGYERREMFSATCAGCGKEARVPFQPRGDRPVYCSDCFQGQRSASGGDRVRQGRRW